MPEMRGEHPHRPVDPEKIGLPLRPFLYSLDQLSVLLDVPEPTLRANYVHYEGRSIGAATRHLMIARNISPPDNKPEWRIAEREVVRWLKFKGFKVYERSSVLY